MGESLKSERTIREYLLGRVSDEATLEGIEELMFTDDEFSTRVALMEDDLVNDYVLGQLDESDAASFRKTLVNNSERRLNLQVAQALKAKAEDATAEAAAGARAEAAEVKPSFFESLREFFGWRMYAGAFALLLVVATASAVYFVVRRGDTDELAELRAIYARERPTESRMSEFGYAPLTQLRGAAQTREANRLRIVENELRRAKETSPNARSSYALGYFLLTQGNFTDAISEFETALRLGDESARVHNDLGAAYFELAKASPKEKRFELLSRSLEEFTVAAESDGDSLEALFNKSLALQELGLPREAKESWTRYLQKDSSSPWAEEARRNLSRIPDEQTRFNPDEQVLRDFLNAYRGGDEARAQHIHDETKGLLRGATVPLQLSRRYLAAKRRGEAAEAAESIEAMAFIGRYEQTRYDEFFFLS
ncbi:MAG TPA: tetratricopeptide repeat protein [Pyrinomonadaceae bacterium]|jgi:tetratricopeptide (TPR) repeat protein